MILIIDTPPGEVGSTRFRNYFHFIHGINEALRQKKMGLFMATQFLQYCVLCVAPRLFYCRFPSLSSSFCSQTKRHFLRIDLLIHSLAISDSLKLSGSLFHYDLSHMPLSSQSLEHSGCSINAYSLKAPAFRPSSGMQPPFSQPVLW